MHPFPAGHATHPDWRMALALAAAQVDARAAAADSAIDGGLGLVYFSDHYAGHAQALIDALHERWPGVVWAGCAAAGVVATGAEYMDEPALSLMVCALPADGFQVFSGAQPLDRQRTWTALVHADPVTPDLGELIGELAERTGSGYLFGGLLSSRSDAVQVADGLRRGGLSGVGFGPGIGLISRVTQGCQPVGPERTITASERHLVLEVDGRPALEALLADLDVDLESPRLALPKMRSTMVGLSAAQARLVGRGAQFGPDTLVRHLVGIDPGRAGVAVGELVEPGMRLAFCRRDVDAARRDLVRICSELREELERDDPGPRVALGAVYVSCVGRGGAHFGGASAELQTVRHALGDVPLVGFFGAGEISRHHLHSYTGVLTVFTAEA